MLCSIIIPLYNKADYITDAIQSVLNQTHQDFEVIVVDDGSKDDGALRVKAFTDRRIKLFEQPNKGVSCARNQGIDLAVGDLICFLDADDWYLPGYLETIVSMATRHPETAFFATHYKPVSNPDKTTMCWDPGDTGEVKFIENIYSLGMNTSVLFYTTSVSIRRNVLYQFKPCFPPGEQSSEDLDLWFRLGEKYRLAYCPAVLVGYRVEVQDSLSATYKPSSLLPVFVRMEQRALKRLIPEELRNSALKLVAEEKISVVRRTLIAGHRYDAVIQLLKTWRGTVSRRWWTTLIMCLVAPPSYMERWENWRIQCYQNDKF
jgi:glycosyltransferase involved in cell wall biosynthesis